MILSAVFESTVVVVVVPMLVAVISTPRVVLGGVEDERPDEGAVLACVSGGGGVPNLSR